MTTIAVVDDQATSRQLLTKLITGLEPNANVMVYDKAAELLTVLDGLELDMLFVDYSMPGINGVELIKKFRRAPQRRDIPIVLVTISEEDDIRLEALEAGATEFLNKPYNFAEFRARTRNLLTLRRYQLGLRDRARYLEQRIADAAVEKERCEQAALRRLLRLMAAYQNTETSQLERFGQTAHDLATACGLDATLCHDMNLAAPLSLIGRAIGTAPLQAEAQGFDGEAIFDNGQSSGMQLTALLHSHRDEKFDGTGQPNGLKGEQIPLPSRVAHTVDALENILRTSSTTLAKALTELSQLSGQWLDPACVNALISIESTLAKRYPTTDNDPA
ncbi:MAG: two-component system response regulator [Lysobacteraceae bacterium]|nr:MAG: two-component system response regulator [Xanthomonadaceae bacterium]